MRQNILYVAVKPRIAITVKALHRLHAKLSTPEDASSQTFHLTHPKLLGKLELVIHVVDSLDAIIPHLREHPVDLLIYDERGPSGGDALADLNRIRNDVKTLAKHWGMDFLFPMSRTVAILEHATTGAMKAFELGQLDVKDVCVAPANTATILRWVQKLLVRRLNSEEKVGMALSGGGVDGFLYQVGAIYALEKALGKSSMQSFKVYSGVSSGAIAATILATRVPVAEVIKAFYRKSKVIPPLSSAMFLDIAGGDIVKRVAQYALRIRGINPLKWFNQIMQIVPMGILKGELLENFLHKMISLYHKPDNFADLSVELFIGATDQDSFEHVVFGKDPWVDIPLSKALRASAALPPFFKPAHIKGRWFIDGQVTKTCNIEMVVERGCKLVFIIDPLQPMSTSIPGNVNHQGGIYGMIQVIKALIYSRFQATLTHLTERFSEVDFVIIQPDEECARLMAGSPMRLRIRKEIIAEAYRSTLRQLVDRHHLYFDKFDKYGLKLAPVTKLRELQLGFDKVLKATG